MKHQMSKQLVLVFLVCGLVGMAFANLAYSYYIQVDRSVSHTYPLQTWNPVEGSLYEGQEEEWTMTLRAGQEYMLYAACDEDCSDVDLRLYDASGVQVAQDTEPDDTPMIAVRPTRTQIYTLKVNMYACGIEPCDYMLGFRQRY